MNDRRLTMFDRRAKNIEIFEDTCNLIKESKKLQEGIEYSVENQKLYLQGKDYSYEVKREKADKPAKVVVSGKRTFEAAEPYVKAGSKVCVLNFASATNPGGGVTHGSSAQEEALCRCSTLYQCLDNEMLWKNFYKPHRQADNPLYNDDILHTPDVWVCKSDINFPERLKESEWYQVDVLTCAAPNLRKEPSNIMNPSAGSSSAVINENEYRKLMKSRIYKIFTVAQTTEADVLILGAFGCGAFRNPPEVVAELFREAVDEYKYYFDTIEFAVYHTERETKNYDAFKKAFA